MLIRGRKPQREARSLVLKVKEEGQEHRGIGSLYKWEKETNSPLECLVRHATLKHLDFSPVSSLLDLWLIELQDNTFVLC